MEFKTTNLIIARKNSFLEVLIAFLDSVAEISRLKKLSLFAYKRVSKIDSFNSVLFEKVLCNGNQIFQFCSVELMQVRVNAKWKIFVICGFSRR